MLDKLEAMGRTASHAIGLIVDRTAAVDLRGVALGTLLYLLSQAVRTRGWHTILRAAFPDATNLRHGDVMRAYLAGAGVNALVPARGGDIVKLALLRRRIDGSDYPTLAATFIPDALSEAAFGIALVVWALANGFLPVPVSGGELPSIDVTLVINHPVIATIVVAVVGLGSWWVARRLRSSVRQGMAIMGTPRRFVTGVVSWQALARVIRLGSFAAFMAAFGLPVTVETVVLVMAAQGGGRILPLAPASAGLRLAMLSYGFVETTGHAVDIAEITTFTFGVGVLLMVAGLVVGLVALAAELETWSPRTALAAARAAVAHHRAAQAEGVT